MQDDHGFCLETLLVVTVVIFRRVLVRGLWFTWRPVVEVSEGTASLLVRSRARVQLWTRCLADDGSLVGLIRSGLTLFCRMPRFVFGGPYYLFVSRDVCLLPL